MPRALAASLALLLALMPGRAQDSGQKKKEEKPPSPKEQYQAIVQEHTKAVGDFSKALSEAKNDEERRKLKFPDPHSYGKRMLELAEKFPTDPVAEEALSWIVTNVRFGPDSSKAIDLLLRDHIQSKSLGQLAETLGYSPVPAAPAAEKQLQVILKKSPHHDVQGKACFALAQLANQQREWARGTAELEGSQAEKLKAEARTKPAEAESLQAKAEKAARAAQSHRATAQKKEQEAENLFERVVKEFAKVPWYNQKTIGDGARGALFELHHLAIGMTAPDIMGEDIDGKKFNLADYRGKVVLLDFWGNW